MVNFIRVIFFDFLFLCQHIGFKILGLCYYIGSATIFTVKILLSLTKPLYFNNLLSHFISIGFFSIPIIALTCFFSGAVLALQSYIGFSRFAGESSIAAVLVLSITREISPVMVGLMISGRVGASMAAEIATMRVTEQIDAMYTLATDPIRYLITPRIIATVIVMPCLVLMGDVIGLLGGYLVSIYKIGFNSANYISKTLQYLKFEDIYTGLVKAFIFGLIISLVSCYSGYFTSKGAKGVGISTINAVVTSSILILISNYIITELMF